METETLEKFVEELAEKICSCDGASGLKLLAKKLNELSEKCNQDVITLERIKFNKTLYDAYYAFYKATNEDSLSLCLENADTGNNCIFNITDIDYNDLNGHLTLYYNKN